jgi:hypothetical protein
VELDVKNDRQRGRVARKIRVAVTSSSDAAADRCVASKWNGLPLRRTDRPTEDADERERS